MKVVVTSKSELQRLISLAVQEAIASAKSPEERLRERKRKKWMTNKEAQEYLGLSRATLQRYRSDGRLPFAKVGSNIFYRRADVDGLLKENMRT